MVFLPKLFEEEKPQQETKLKNLDEFYSNILKNPNMKKLKKEAEMFSSI
jgi:hypothetical protein